MRFTFFFYLWIILFCFPQVCLAQKCCLKWTRAIACQGQQGVLPAALTLSMRWWKSAGSAVPSSDLLLLTCTVSLMTSSSTLSPTTRVLIFERRVETMARCVFISDAIKNTLHTFARLKTRQAIPIGVRKTWECFLIAAQNICASLQCWTCHIH